MRKELTDEWDARGVQKGVEYAILTDEITKAWSGMNTRQYKNLKGLQKENLRDNMTTLDLVLNMLAEATTTEISKQKAPEGLRENVEVARSGGKVAGYARKAIEQQTGVPVITSKNAAQLRQDDRVIDVENAGRGLMEIGICQELAALVRQINVFLVRVKFHEIIPS